MEPNIVTVAQKASEHIERTCCLQLYGVN